MNSISLEQARDKGNSAVLNSEATSALSKHMNTILAEEYALFTKTLNFHWNLTGVRFHSLHTFLGTHYNELLEDMDGIAERIRMIGNYPISTMKEMVQLNEDIEENPGKHPSANQMINELALGHLRIQKKIKMTLKEDLFSEDPGSEDFLVSLLQRHEKKTWMLQSHLA